MTTTFAVEVKESVQCKQGTKMTENNNFLFSFFFMLKKPKIKMKIFRYTLVIVWNNHWTQFRIYTTDDSSNGKSLHEML